MILLQANWNRPVIIVMMICITIMTCVALAYGPRWFK